MPSESRTLIDLTAVESAMLSVDGVISAEARVRALQNGRTEVIGFATVSENEDCLCPTRLLEDISSRFPAHCRPDRVLLVREGFPQHLILKAA